MIISNGGRHTLASNDTADVLSRLTEIVRQYLQGVVGIPMGTVLQKLKMYGDSGAVYPRLT